MAKKGPEYKVKMRVKKLLDEHGAWYFMPPAAAFGRSGIPDFIVCHRGCFVAVECKAGNNATTPLQERELGAIRGAGGWGLVCNEDRIEGDQGLQGLLELITQMADRNRDNAAANMKAVREERQNAEEGNADDGAGEAVDDAIERAGGVAGNDSDEPNEEGNAGGEEAATGEPAETSD